MPADKECFKAFTGEEKTEPKHYWNGLY